VKNFLNSPFGAMQALSAPFWLGAWFVGDFTIVTFLIAWVIVSVLQLIAFGAS